MSDEKLIKFQQSQAISSDLESFWSIVYGLLYMIILFFLSCDIGNVKKVTESNLENNIV